MDSEYIDRFRFYGIYVAVVICCLVACVMLFMPWAQAGDWYGEVPDLAGEIITSEVGLMSILDVLVMPIYIDVPYSSDDGTGPGLLLYLVAQLTDVIFAILTLRYTKDLLEAKYELGGLQLDIAIRGLLSLGLGAYSGSMSSWFSIVTVFLIATPLLYLRGLVCFWKDRSNPAGLQLAFVSSLLLVVSFSVYLTDHLDPYLVITMTVWPIVFGIVAIVVAIIVTLAARAERV